MADHALEDVKKEIRRRSDNFEEFFRNGDAAGLVNDYYVEEPLMSAPDVPLMRSRAEIEGLFTEIMKGYAECLLVQEEVRTSGDLAYELGRGLLKSKDGEEGEARYTILWRKVPDGWRVELDFFAFGALLGA
jgi:ketosteroid isomerase-like protein